MKDFLKKSWYIDNGCSIHITGDASKFTHISRKKSGYVTYGDNNKGKILGIGKNVQIYLPPLKLFYLLMVSSIVY